MSSAQPSWNPMKRIGDGLTVECQKVLRFGDGTRGRCDFPRGHKSAHGVVGYPNENGGIVRSEPQNSKEAGQR